MSWNTFVKELKVVDLSLNVFSTYIEYIFCNDSFLSYIFSPLVLFTFCPDM